MRLGCVDCPRADVKLLHERPGAAMYTRAFVCLFVCLLADTGSRGGVRLRYLNRSGLMSNSRMSSSRVNPARQHARERSVSTSPADGRPVRALKGNQIGLLRLFFETAFKNRNARSIFVHPISHAASSLVSRGRKRGERSCGGRRWLRPFQAV